MSNFVRSVIEAWEPGQPLKLSFLGLTHIPSDIPDSVRSLSLTCNRLRSLKDLPEQLHTLYLAGNLLTELPNSLPSSLKTLFINDNQLTTLPETLPISLEKIMAYSNQLETLPELLPKSLQILAINHNNLQQLPKSLPDSLIFLNVSNNPLLSLPDNLPSQLIYCVVRNTQLSFLPSCIPSSLRFLGTEGSQLPVYLPGETVHQFHYRIETQQSKKRCVGRLKSIKEDLIAATWETSRVEPWCGERWDDFS